MQQLLMDDYTVESPDHVTSTRTYSRSTIISVDFAGLMVLLTRNMKQIYDYFGRFWVLTSSFEQQ